MTSTAVSNNAVINFNTSSSFTREFGSLDFSADNLNCISEIGRGNGGIVFKIQHKPTGILLVRKVYQLDLSTKTRAQIMRDLQVRHFVLMFNDFFSF